MTIQKPTIKIKGLDGNIFAVMAVASRELKRAGLKEQAYEMQNRIMTATNYHAALAIIGEYIKWE